MRFLNREEAGLLLAHALAPHGAVGARVIAVAHGGAAVAVPVARALGAPLDVVIARKIEAPGRADIYLGAVSEGGARWVEVGRAGALGVSPEAARKAAACAEEEVRRRAEVLRGGRRPVPLHGCTAIVVDDGLATGATARAAVQAVRLRGAARIVLGVPVGARSVVAALGALVDRVVCLWQPAELHSIGEWYEDFPELGDDEVVELLGLGHREGEEPRASAL